MVPEKWKTFLDVIKVNIYACKYTNSKYYNFLNDFQTF